jgi:gluconolactonase
MPRQPAYLAVFTALTIVSTWLGPATPLVAQEQKGKPKGEVRKYTFDKSKVFPGTTRDYWIYVPTQYDPAKPACVYVNQDGDTYKAPAVFDELIAKGEMPVTIGVFVQPGKVKSPSTDALDRFNRSFEYDGLGDNYARFVLDELLPDVETKTTQDGKPIRLSKDGNDRAIGGASSGAIAAFTVAWERPDAFRRVFSSIGTYVGLRGGNVYPTLIRKYEPKPLRVFLEDGSGDQNIYGGDWWMANQEMERALIFAGYEVNHSWGTGGHNGEHATQIFPDAMRWLWKDYPAPIKVGEGSKPLREILIPGEGWTLVAEAGQRPGVRPRWQALRRRRRRKCGRRLRRVGQAERDRRGVPRQ